jgi:DNA-binding NarL/FixJ family response regulator
VRILIADHQSAVRSALRLLLHERLELDALGEAADSQELLAQLEQLRPDIILLDRDLPGWTPANLSDAFDGLDRRPKMIVLGAHPETVQTAGAAGADAFVSKCDPPKRLLSTIRALSVEG